MGFLVENRGEFLLLLNDLYYFWVKWSKILNEMSRDQMTVNYWKCASEKIVNGRKFWENKYVFWNNVIDKKYMNK